MKIYKTPRIPHLKSCPPTQSLTVLTLQSKLKWTRLAGKTLNKWSEIFTSEKTHLKLWQSPWLKEFKVKNSLSPHKYLWLRKETFQIRRTWHLTLRVIVSRFVHSFLQQKWVVVVVLRLGQRKVWARYA